MRAFPLYRLYVAIALLSAIAVGILVYTPHALAALSANDAAALRSMGIDPNVADPSLTQQLLGGCDGDPYQMLQTQFRGSPGTGITPHVSNGQSNDLTDGLNPTLACRLLKFFQYAQQTQSCSFKITYGFRSSAEQASMCGPNGSGTGCIAPGASCHQYGLAADVVSSGSCIEWARSFLGQKNPGSPGAQQFKLHFPYSGDHIQCIENTQANCSPSTQGCGGNFAIKPNNNFTPSPFQSMTQGLQSLFTPPRPQQCPPGYMMMNGTCLPPQAAQATQTTSPLSYISPPPPPPTSIPSATGTTSTTNTNTNSNTNTTDTSSGINISGLINYGNSPTQTSSTTSAIDLINAIANPTTTAPNPSAAVSTGTPVALASNLNNPVALHGTNVSVDGSWQSSSTYALSPEVSQTFVSQDLSKTPTSLQPMQPVNSTFAILEDLKQKLLYIISFLRPFGGVMPSATNVNGTATAYLE